MLRTRAFAAVLIVAGVSLLSIAPATASSSTATPILPKRAVAVPAASIAINPGAQAGAILLGAFKFQSFGSHSADDLYLGIVPSDTTPSKNRINFYTNASTPNTGVKSGDCSGDWNTSGSNIFVMEYQPSSSDRLTITLSNTSVVSDLNCSLIYNNFTTAISTAKGLTTSKLLPLMNYIEVTIKRDSNNYTSTLTGLTLSDATSLGTFNPSGTTAKTSNITGFHLGNGFKLSGTLDLNGAFGNCAGACYVEISFGALPSQIVVEKTVAGLTPPTTWQFAGPKGNFTLPAIGGTTVITPLGSATVAITETTKAGFIASTACSNGVNGSNSVSFAPDAGATITCTFTNAITPAYSTVTVKPSQLQGWLALAEPSPGTEYPIPLDFQLPPPAPALGIGHAALVLTQTNVGKLFYAPILTGTKLSDLLVLTYSTHIVDGQTPTIQIGWDDDSTDANAGWRGRLVFVPNATAGTWQTWNALSDSAGTWFTTYGTLADNACKLGSTNGCTWSQILAKFPNAVIHPNNLLGFVGVKAGSGGSGTSYFDALTIAANQNITTYDFEPETPCTTVCYADAVNGNDINGGAFITNAKKTIQAAVNAVQANGTVIAAAGTYSELVTVNKAVTLQGAQSDVSGVGRCDASAGESMMNDPRGAFYITADGVTIEGFVIQDQTQVWMGAGTVIAPTTSGHTLRNNVFRDNIDGLYLNSSGTQPTLVENNCFTHNNVAGAAGGNGIYADQGTNNVTVRGNYFTGHQTAAILLTKYSTYTVSQLTIVSNTMENDNRIRLTYANDALISGNVFTNSAVHGVQVAGGSSDITITQNTVVSPTYAGVRISDVDEAGANSNILVLSNTLTGGQYGVWIADSVSGLNVFYNTLTGNKFGVLNDSTALASGSRINRNDLSDSITNTIKNANAELLNGECNWYGSNAGPGNSIAGNIDTVPWLTSSDLHGPCELGTITMQKVVSGTAPASGEFGFHLYKLNDFNAIPFTLTAGSTRTITGLLPGQYLVNETRSLGYDNSVSCNTGAETIDNGFFNVLPNSVITCTVTNMGLDDVDGNVWFDQNNNGNFDDAELPLPNVTVTLSGTLGGCKGLASLNPQEGPQCPTGTILTSTVTDADGNYAFAGLPEGHYVVTVMSDTLPAGLRAPTYDLDGIETPHTASFDLCSPEGEPQALSALGDGPPPMQGCLDDSVDFGYRGEGRIGDHVFFDVNGDGAQDAGDPPLAGVTLHLTGDLNGEGSTDTLTATTNSSGDYGFANLPAGTFTITVDAATLPAGVSPVAGAGSIGANETSLTLADAETRDDIDFGYKGNLSVGDSVFYDLNNNGVQDAGDLALPNVTLNLSSDPNNAIVVDVLTATTNAAGIYYFSAVPAGVYTISVNAATLPAGMTPTADLDSIATPHQAGITLGDAPRFDVDFGYRGTGSIGDLVWEDTNGNGSYDAGEPGLAAAITLMSDLNNDGALDTLNTTASSAGAYAFSNLIPGTFTITVKAASLPANMQPVHGMGSIGSFTATFNLDEEEANSDVDFGFVRPAVAHGRVWLDVNRNGQQDAGEPGLPDVTIKLYVAQQAALNAQTIVMAGPISTTTSDANGDYSFGNIVPGRTYTMSFVLPNGASWTTPGVGDPNSDSDVDANGNAGPFTLTSGANVVLNVSAGTTKPTQIAITKTAQPATVRRGDNITYTLVVRNAGATLAQNVVVTDGLPAEMTFISASPMPSMQSPALTWAVGDLMPGQAFTITLIGNVKQDAIIADGVRNTAFVSAAQQSIVASDLMQSSAFVPLQPTAIHLASFNAVLAGDGVKLTWRTSLEQNTFGFNVLRSATSNRSDAVTVNAQIIAAVGANNAYSLIDNAGSLNSTYWLQEVDLSGATTDYGPFRVSEPALVAQPVQQPAQQSGVNAVVLPAGVPMGGVPVAHNEPAPITQQPAAAVAQPDAETILDVSMQPAVVAPAVSAVTANMVEPAYAAPVEAAPSPQSSVASQPMAPVAAGPAVPAEAAQPSQTVTPSEISSMENVVIVMHAGRATMPAVRNATPAEEASASDASDLPINIVVAGVLAVVAGAGGTVALRRRRAVK